MSKQGELERHYIRLMNKYGLKTLREISKAMYFLNMGYPHHIAAKMAKDK